MKIEFKNIGFVKSGIVDTNNLTVIFGPNNVGKTYLSYSIYAAVSLYNNTIRRIITLPKKVISEAARNGVSTFNLDSFFSDSLSDKVSEELSSELPRFFNSGVKFFSKSKIKVINDSLHSNVLSAEIDIEFSLQSDCIIRFKKLQDSYDMAVFILPGDDEKKIPPIATLQSEVSIFFSHVILRRLLSGLNQDSFIITSERTGISLFQKEIDGNRNSFASSIAWDQIVAFEKNRVAAFDDLINDKIAPFSEPINHNIKIVRDFNNERSSKAFAAVNRATSLRKNKHDIIECLEGLTQGRYTAQGKSTIYTVNKRNDSDEEVSVPISLSSASNKSLFLFDVYIRSYMKPGSFLIIDEPELNLHPRNQIKMAGLLVRLANYGVKVVITTHSDYIVKEINNRIMAKSISSDEVNADFNYKDVDTIDGDLVNAYSISDDGEIISVEKNEFGICSFLFDESIFEIEERSGKLYGLLMSNNDEGRKFVSGALD